MKVLKKITIKLSDMDCASCAIQIDGELEEREGVACAKTTYTRSQTEVEFDPEKISEEKIVEIIKNTGISPV